MFFVNLYQTIESIEVTEAFETIEVIEDVEAIEDIEAFKVIEFIEDIEAIQYDKKYKHSLYNSFNDRNFLLSFINLLQFKLGTFHLLYYKQI